MWNWIAVNTNPLLVLVGAAGVIVACITLWKIRGQTKAAEDAAKAALLQAKHVETAERAWLLVNYVDMAGKELEDKVILELRWTIKNVGSTPAVLLETKARFQVINIYPDMPEAPEKELPEIPDYGKPIIISERLLAPNDSIGYFTKWERRIDGKYVEFAFPADSDRIWMIVAFGYVKYKDTFGKEHESRSCDMTWVKKNRLSDLGYRPHPKTPAAYNHCT